MTEEEIVDRLKALRGSQPPSETVKSVIDLHETAISQFDMIRYLKSAYSDIPLRILNEASGYHLISGEAGMRDEDFDRLLRPWFDIGSED